jgi:NTE family protein
LTSGDPTFAIAFGGGGARGLAHIHVIEAFDELGIKPVAIAGSSIGAIMGAAMAAGMSGAEIRDYTLSVVGKPAEVMNRIWSLRPASIGAMLKGGGWVGQYNLERILKAFLPARIPADFSGLSIPLMVTATDYYGREEVVTNSGDLYLAMAASAALPAVFMPVMLNGRIMIDGGIYNPVPFDLLRGVADIVVGVDVVGAPEGDGITTPARIESLFGASQLMMHSITTAKLKIEAPQIFLRPDVNGFRALEFLKANEILKKSEAVKDRVKAAIDAEFVFRMKR